MRKLLHYFRYILFLTIPLLGLLDFTFDFKLINGSNITLILILFYLSCLIEDIFIRPTYFKKTPWIGYT